MSDTGTCAHCGTTGISHFLGCPLNSEYQSTAPSAPNAPAGPPDVLAPMGDDVQRIFDEKAKMNPQGFWAMAALAVRERDALCALLLEAVDTPYRADAPWRYSYGHELVAFARERIRRIRAEGA